MKTIIISAALSCLAGLAALAQASVTLAWDASPGTNIIAGYRIYYGVASRSYTNIQDVGTALTGTVTNLAGGSTYYFAATAYDTDGLESDYSSEVLWQAQPVKPKPATPDALRPALAK